MRSKTTTRWSYRAGERGRNRVRAFEEARTGILYVEWYEDERPRRRSLGHRDPEAAKRTADELAAAFGANQSPPSREPTLRELFDMYGREMTPTKSAGTQKHDHMCRELFLRYLEPSRKVTSLSVRDWQGFIADRKSGRVSPAGKRKPSPVGNRQVAYDLKWLLAVLNWATLARRSDGQPLLDRNPLRGLPIPKEESPRRPVISEERYQAMLGVASDVDWRFEVALVLAHETGHRIGAIRALRWSDVDLVGERVLWRGENDKIRYRHVTPITDVAVRAFEMARQHNPAIGSSWVLPSPCSVSAPCSRHLATKWWQTAEERAGLEPVKQLGWHSLRRRFATDLMDQPLKVLCELGGWKEPQTLLKCYQSPSEEDQRRALEARRRRAVGDSTY